MVLSFLSWLWGWLTDRGDPVPPTPPAPPPAGDWPAQLLALHNQSRRAAGLSSLTADPLLARVAQDHAAWMESTRMLAHSEGELSPFDRLDRVGYRYREAGENIAFSQPDAVSVHAAWMSSPGHRANILGPSFSQVGFGRVNTWWCAVFGRPA